MQMVEDKIPAIIQNLGFRVARLDTKFLESISTDDIDDIHTGRLALIGHWNALEHVKILMERLELKDVLYILDEADDLITNKDTDKETFLSEIMASGRLHATISVSATQLGWLRFIQQNGFPLDNYVACKPRDLKRLKYRGLEKIDVLKDASGDPIWIPEEPAQPKRENFPRGGDGTQAFKAAKEDFKWEKAEYPFQKDFYFGIDSDVLKALVDKFNKSRRKNRMLFLSLGALVEKGFEVQAKRILTTLSPKSKVLVISAGGGSHPHIPRCLFPCCFNEHMSVHVFL